MKWFLVQNVRMTIFSVTELNIAIKNILEPNFQAIQVRGEISNFKLQTSGHLYFSLKDSNSQISAVIFKSSAQSLGRLPKEGDQVIALGELSLYSPRGQYQIVIRQMQFLGQGELLLKLHQLKEQLQARGWFDSAKKKALPKIPKKIGIVTSPTGAVIQDIINVLSRRFSGFHIILNPVKVQGPGAAQEIAKAIDDFNEYNLVDVLIVGRGGGSIEDLWAFNEEIVAKAIFDSKIPIISAVGHETDFTIADFVADVRAPTPSAAAELVIAEKANMVKFLEQTQLHLYQRMRQQILQGRQRLQALQRHPWLHSPLNILLNPTQKLDDLRQDLDVSMKQSLKQNQLKLSHLKTRLELLKPSSQIKSLKETLRPYPDRFLNAMQQLLTNKKNYLHKLSEHLRSIHPDNLLKKGFSIVQLTDGSVVQSTRDLSSHQNLTILLQDGRVLAEIQKVQPYDN